MDNRLTNLLQALDEGAARRAMLETYYAGQQPLAFLAPEARAALGTRFGRMATNLPRLAVSALAERLRVVGFTGADVWDDWLANDLDQVAPVAHREALTLGEAYLIVWARPDGAPLVTAESAAQVAVRRDPATRAVTAAVKRWETGTTTEAVLYEADSITRLSANHTGATVAGFKTVHVLPNPLGVVPVVPLRNSDRLLGPAASELDDLIPLVDALNKALADMMVSSEHAGRPRRWATGLELTEDDVLDAAGNPTGQTTPVSPVQESDRMMVAESADTKFGQLAAADLGGYEAAVRVLQAQISAVSGLPPHYLGVHGDQPASADALRASEASLTARAEARQAVFGRAWEQVARLMVAVRDGSDPATVNPRVQWADPATRSVAQEADAITKLYGAGLLPASYALRRLGYNDTEIEQIRLARRVDALDGLVFDPATLAPAGLP